MTGKTKDEHARRRAALAAGSGKKWIALKTRTENNERARGKNGHWRKTRQSWPTLSHSLCEFWSKNKQTKLDEQLR